VYRDILYVERGGCDRKKVNLNGFLLDVCSKSKCDIYVSRANHICVSQVYHICEKHIIDIYQEPIIYAYQKHIIYSFRICGKNVIHA